MCDRVGRARLDAIAAKDAAVVIDVVDLGVALRGRDALLLGVLCRLDINAVCRAGCRAQKTGHALLESVLVALQDVRAAISLLEPGPTQRPRPIGVVLHLRR